MNNRDLFLRFVAQTSDAPLALEIERAEGIYMYDNSGNRYMDLISGISVSNIGHRHPKVVEAIKTQSDKYLHLMVYGEYIQSPQVELAHYLSNLLPEGLDVVYYGNSGAEATEGAIKLAKRYTGRPSIVSFKQSYHGSTQGSLTLMGDEYFKRAYRPLLPGVKVLPYNDPQMLDEINESTAAVIMEPIQAESGITVPDGAFVRALRERCTKMGALLIFDEVQTGFGRTGKLFAFEHYDVVPDVITFAKGMGGGLPIGAFVSSKEKMDVLTNNPVLGHITTFGGNAVCCAAALANIKVIVEEKLHETVAAKEQLFVELLSKNPKINKITHKGLMVALHFDSFETNKKVIDQCISNGIITDWFLFAPNCLRIGPPLIITEEEIRAACEVINAAVEEWA